MHRSSATSRHQKHHTHREPPRCWCSLSRARRPRTKPEVRQREIDCSAPIIAGCCAATGISSSVRLSSGGGALCGAEMAPFRSAAAPKGGRKYARRQAEHTHRNSNEIGPAAPTGCSKKDEGRRSSVSLFGQHYVQNEQTGGTEADRHGCRKEKCREALCSRLLLLPLLVVVPGSGWTCPEWCARRCCSKSFMIKFILKSAASLRSMTPETRSESRCGPQASWRPSRRRKMTAPKPYRPSGCTPSPSTRVHGQQPEAASGRSHGRSGPRCPKMSPS
eukprot:COSAG06_NODE_957_length_11322_cov_9.239686_7_plen_276_part_00